MLPEHYKFLTALLRRECGLVLDADKTYLAESRLAPVARQFGRDDIDDLIANVMAAAPRQAITAIVDAMVTNETYFFRDRQPFTHFATETLPQLIEARQDTKRLQIWSAAASTGQEAYSLAMILSTYAAQLAGWRVSLIGTDISHQAIARAKLFAIALLTFMHTTQSAQPGEAGDARAACAVVIDLRTFDDHMITSHIVEQPVDGFAVMF